MARIALLGHGVVGSGVAELLMMNCASIAERAGEKIELKSILDIREFPELPYADRFTKNYDDILSDDEISVVVEVMGGLHPSYDYVKAALLSGKSVVTSNKELVAEKGSELLRIAKENNVHFLFEASVGGGIPIIRPMTTCLAANTVEEVAGILNGTTNFILTKMIREQMPFEEALRLAQSLGYAERNPAADIEGIDACRKICILASLAYGTHIYPEEVLTEGITGVGLEDIAYAEDFGSVVKLIGCARKLEDGKIFVLVAPALIDDRSQLARVDDVFNAILVRGNAAGDVIFYGRGAGKLPTASAVIADVIDAVKCPGADVSLPWGEAEKGRIADPSKVPLRFYLRCEAQDAAAARNAVMDRLGHAQVLVRKGMPANELGFVVGPLTEEELDSALSAIPGLAVKSKLRVLSI